MSSGTSGFGEDFGQKVDLTASIRNILRNYPEGTAILKELVQNADDAGARTVRFCLDHRTHRSEKMAAAALAQFQGPSLLVSNDAVFTAEDFASIQRIGDSLKNTGGAESKTKIGRFGIGFNAVYHWTELPSFISDHYLVMLDPSAKYLPNVNPNNPGKIVDWIRNKELLTDLRDQFAPYAVPDLNWNRPYPGTLFRLPLRTQAQADASSLSKRALDINQVNDVLQSLALEAASMLLFLRNVERIEISEWRPFSSTPETTFSCFLDNITPALRSQRCFDEMLGRQRAANIAAGRVAIADFTLLVRTTSRDFGNIVDHWRVCTQFGGGNASLLAKEPSNGHLKLVPIAGVAACVRSEGVEPEAVVAKKKKAGVAYCFLPLPIQTELPVMVNGFFELSSNRRDIWQASVDMTGDGSARARWNDSILNDVVAPCYVRLLRFAKDSLGFTDAYESLWPSHLVPRPWSSVMAATLSLVRKEPLLLTTFYAPSSAATTAASTSVPTSNWINVNAAVVLPLQHKALASRSDHEELLHMLRLFQVPVVQCTRPLLHETLIQTHTCTILATPGFVRSLLQERYQASLSTSTSISSPSTVLQASMCRFLLHYVLSDVVPAHNVTALHNLPIIPLLNGSIGTLCTFSSTQQEAIQQVTMMGYSLQESILSLQQSKYDLGRACDALGNPETRQRFLLGTQQKANSRPYFILAGEEEWNAFASVDASREQRGGGASACFVDSRLLHPDDVELLRSVDFQRAANLPLFQPALIKDILPCILPKPCLEGRCVVAAKELSGANSSWLRSFAVRFWAYASTKSSVISAIVETYALVPCDDYEAWYPLSKLSNMLCVQRAEQQLKLDIQQLCQRVAIPLLDVITNANASSATEPRVDWSTMPRVFWEYIHAPTRSGVLEAMWFLLRGSSEAAFLQKVSGLSDNEKDALRLFIADGPLRELSDQLQAAVRALPIFPTHRKSLSNFVIADSANLDKQYVSLLSAPGVKLVTLPNYENINPLFLYPELITHSSSTELRLLQHLQVPLLRWTDFYRQILRSAVDYMKQDRLAYEAFIGKMLLELSSIAREDAPFVTFLKNSAFMPTMSGDALNSVDKLYDPNNVEIAALLSSEFFPSDTFASEEIVAVLKSLGLLTIIDWRGVIDCARSVEGIDVVTEEDIVKKQERATYLLTYLDRNIARLLGEDKKPAAKPSKGGSSAFSIFSSFFQDSSSSNNDQSGMRPEEIEQYLLELRNIAWVPVLTTPPDKFMPWKDHNSSDNGLVADDKLSVLSRTICAAPINCAPLVDAWLCSASFFIVAHTVREPSLMRVLRWQSNYNVQTLAIQLRALANVLQTVQTNQENNSQAFLGSMHHDLRQRIGSISHTLYDRLDKHNHVDTVRGFLEQADWIWVGDRFVSLNKVALTFSVHAAPYLYQLPEDIKAYNRLLGVFSVKSTFSYRDYITTLREMALESGYQAQVAATTASGTGSMNVNHSGRPLSEAMVDAAVALVSLISNETANVLQSQVIFVPDVNAKLAPSPQLVNDDVPWLTSGAENMAVRAACRLVHPNISSKVAEKVGVKSMRLDILSKSLDTTGLFEISGGTKTIESFGQAESLTNRLKTILDLYPDGGTILHELVQNADDAGATIVKIVVDENYYATESLMDRRMEPLQGPALLFQNNAVFSEADFKSLASVGQGSKLEKLATTGRFGLGFNSTYHLTDTPMFVSGDHFVFFDPHCTYVPGATVNQPGIKFQYTQPQSNLTGIFPHQFAPFQHCGFNPQERYNGTLFRFPLRTALQARGSGISKRSYTLIDLNAVVDQMITQLTYISLFLRSVQRIEIYRCYEGSKTETLLYTSSAKVVAKQFFHDQSLLDYFDKQKTTLSVQQQQLQFSRDSFYTKLMATPDSQLPKEAVVKTITSEKYHREKVKHRAVAEYVSIHGLVGGNAKRLACSEAARHLKLVPFGGVSCCTRLTEEEFGGEDTGDVSRASSEKVYPPINGQAFCFLPMPIFTQLPVFVNAYWELSSNRRDIWRGDDTKGESKLRSDWNKFVLEDVVTQLYAALLRSLAGKSSVSSQEKSLQILQMLPDKALPAPWDTIRSALLPHMLDIPLLWTKLSPERPLSLENALLLDANESANLSSNTVALNTSSGSSQAVLHAQRLESLLLADKLPVVCCASSIVEWVKAFGQASFLAEHVVSPAFIRRHFSTGNRFSHSVFDTADGASPSRANSFAAFLLQYALSDLSQVGHTAFHGVALLPLQNETLGVIEGPTDAPPFYLLNAIERKLLMQLSDRVVADDESLGVELSRLLLPSDSSRMSVMDIGWNIRRIDEVGILKLLCSIVPKQWMNSNVQVVERPASITDEWISDLWQYITSEKKLELYYDTLPLVPVISPNLLGSKGSATTSNKYLAKLHKSVPIIQNAALFNTLLMNNQNAGTEPNAALQTTASTAKSSQDQVAQMTLVMALYHVGIYLLDERTASTFLTHKEVVDKQIYRPQSPSVLLEAFQAVASTLHQAAKSWSAAEKLAIHNLVLDDILRSDFIPQPTQKELLLSLPIWPVHRQTSNYKFPDCSTLLDTTDSNRQVYTFTSLEPESHFLPPHEIQSEFLDSIFILVRSDADRVKYEKLDLKSVSYSQFVTQDILPKIDEQLLPDEQLLWIGKFILRHLNTIVQEVPGILERLQETNFIRNDAPVTSHQAQASSAMVSALQQQWVTPKELYDLDVASLSEILPRSCFPDRAVYREIQLLLGLRKLGLRREINCLGILRAAKSIEVEQRLLPTVDSATASVSASAASASTSASAMVSTNGGAVADYTTLFNRCCSLLRYLEANITRLCEEADSEGMQVYNAARQQEMSRSGAVRSEGGDERLSDLGGRWAQELRSILWIAVYTTPPKEFQGKGLPWPKRVHATPFAAPTQCTNRQNLWLGSSTLRIASVEIVSPLLQIVLGWDQTISGTNIAVQMINIASEYMIIDATSDNSLSAAKSKYDEIYPFLLGKLFTCYQQESTEESKLWLRSLERKPIIWTSSGHFIEPQRVSFTSVANVNVEPYLYIANPYMQPYRDMLLKIGVREAFEASDLALITRKLFETHQQRSLDTVALMDALGVVTVLHRMLMTKHAAAQRQPQQSTQEQSQVMDGESTEGDAGNRADIPGLETIPLDGNQVNSPKESLQDDVRNLGVIYLPDNNHILRPAAELIYNDAPWISTSQVNRFTAIKFLHPRLDPSIGELLGCRSFREVLFAGENVYCPSSKIINSQIAHCTILDTMNDLMSIADNHAVKSMQFLYDPTSYPSESMLHPGLAKTQGPALLAYFPNKALSFEEISKLFSLPSIAMSALSSPSSPNTSGNVYMSQVTMARGYRLLSTFAVTDCLQILSGSDFFIFDPCHQYLVHDSSADEAGTDGQQRASQKSTKGKTGSKEAEEGKAQKFSLAPRNNNHSLSTSSANATSSATHVPNNLALNFTDQFAPFCAASEAVRAELISRGRISGTIIRLPLRPPSTAPSSHATLLSVSDHTVNLETVKRVFGHFKTNITACLCFAEHLSSVSLFHKESRPSSSESSSGSDSASAATDGQMVLDVGVDMISDTSLRSSRWAITKVSGWERSGLSSLLSFKAYQPQEKSYRLSFTIRLGLQGWMDPQDNLRHRIEQLQSSALSGQEMSARATSPTVCYPEVWIIISCMGIETFRQLAVSEPFASMKLFPIVTMALPVFERADLKQHHLSVDEGWMVQQGSVLRATGLPCHIEGQFISILRHLPQSAATISNMNNRGGQASQVCTTWNEMVLTTALLELYARFIRDFRGALEENGQNRDEKEQEGLYKYWLYAPRLTAVMKPVVTGSKIMVKLATERLFLLERNVFATLDKVLFPTRDFTNPTITYLRSTVPLARTPTQIGVDFSQNRHIVPPPALFTPMKFRTMLIRDSNLHWRRLNALCTNGTNGTLSMTQGLAVVLELLDFAISDFMLPEVKQDGEFTQKSLFASLRGCPILPCADNAVGMFPLEPGRRIAYGPTVLYGVLPAEVLNRMIRPELLQRLPLFQDAIFKEAVGLCDFTPAFLKSVIHSILPQQLLAQKGLVWVDSFDQQTTFFDTQRFEHILYVLWNHCFMKLPFTQLLELGDFPLLPVVSAGKRVLLPIHALPHVFTPVTTTAEHEYRLQLKAQIEGKASAYTLPDAQDQNTLSNKAWAWTSEPAMVIPRSVVEPVAVATDGATVEASNVAVVAENVAISGSETTNLTPTAILSTLNLSVESFAALKKLGLPFLDTLIFEGKPLAMQQQEHLQAQTYQHIGRKILDAVHHFGVANATWSDLVNTPTGPASSSSSAFSVVSCLEFSTLTFGERYELLSQIHGAHRTQAFNENVVDQLRQLPLFTNLMTQEAVPIRSPSSWMGGSGSVVASALSSMLTGSSAQQQQQVYWCADAGRVMQSFGGRMLPTSSVSASSPTAAPVTTSTAGDNSQVVPVILQNTASLTSNTQSAGNLSDMFRWLQVPELTPSLAITSFVLPTMDSMTMAEKVAFVKTLATDWESTYKRDNSLVQALKQKRFIPLWDVDAPELWQHNATIIAASTQKADDSDHYVASSVRLLRTCEEVILWTNKELHRALKESAAYPAYYAPPSMQLPELQAMFRDLGMRDELNESLITRITEDIQHTYMRSRGASSAGGENKEYQTQIFGAAQRRGRGFLHYLLGTGSGDGSDTNAESTNSAMVGSGDNRFLALCTGKAAFLQKLGKVKFVPVQRPKTIEAGGFVVYEDDIVSYDTCVGLFHNGNNNRQVRAQQGGSGNSTAAQNLAALLSFSVLPLLDSDLLPPTEMFSMLGILHPSSPPTKEVVQQHIANVTVFSEHVLDRWNCRHFSIIQTFTAIFGYLSDQRGMGGNATNTSNSSSISPEQPLIPVGHTLVPATRIFFALPKPTLSAPYGKKNKNKTTSKRKKAGNRKTSGGDNKANTSDAKASSTALLAPFLYELPRAFASFETFFKSTLRMRESPAFEDYLRILQEVSGHSSVNATSHQSHAGNEVVLNPNELRAVIAILQMMVTSLAETEPEGNHVTIDSDDDEVAAASQPTGKSMYERFQDQLYLPDHRGVMRPLHALYVNEDAYLQQRVQTLLEWSSGQTSTNSLQNYHILHPALCKATGDMADASISTGVDLVATLHIQRLRDMLQERLTNYTAYSDNDAVAFEMDQFVDVLRREVQSHGTTSSSPSSPQRKHESELGLLSKLLYTEDVAKRQKAEQISTMAHQYEVSSIVQFVHNMQCIIVSRLQTQFFLRTISISARNGTKEVTWQPLVSDTSARPSSNQTNIYYLDKERRTLYINRSHPWFASAGSTNTNPHVLCTRVLYVVALALCDIWRIPLAHADIIMRSFQSIVTSTTSTSSVAASNLHTEALDSTYLPTLLRYLDVPSGGMNHTASARSQARPTAADVAAESSTVLRMGEIVRAYHRPLLELKPFRGYYVDEIVAYMDSTSDSSAASASVESAVYRYGRVVASSSSSTSAAVAGGMPSSGIQYVDVLCCEAEDSDDSDVDSDDDIVHGNSGSLKRKRVQRLLSTDVYSFRPAHSSSSTANYQKCSNKDGVQTAAKGTNAAKASAKSPSSLMGGLLSMASASGGVNGKAKAVAAPAPAPAPAPVAAPAPSSASVEMVNLQEDDVDTQMTLQALQSLLQRAHLPMTLEASELVQRILTLETQQQHLEATLAKERDDWKRAQRQVAVTTAQFQCQLCLTNSVNVAFVNCGHNCCSSCSSKLLNNRCPFCRRNITAKIPLYFQAGDNGEEGDEAAV